MRTKVLILVKTYPTLSSKYDELVCTAGMKEDGSWVRIYPIPFRKLDYEKKYKKYQWIELDLVKNRSDIRPESYRPQDFDKMALGSVMGSDNGYWTQRRALIFQKGFNTNLSQLIADAKDKSKRVSLAVFKPSKIIDFVVEETERGWDSRRLRIITQRAQQLNLFKNAENPFKVVKKLPYKFYYVFEDDQRRRSTLMIEDWEIAQLFWNELARYGDEKKACESVKMKYFDNFAKTKDVYFFLGTTMLRHFTSKNPFIIIGVFYPKFIVQPSLF